MSRGKKMSHCIHCGCSGGDVVFVSNGKEAKVKHESPFTCIDNLKKQIDEIRSMTARAVAAHTVYGG